MTILSFIACLLIFTLIGVLSVLKNRHTNLDYLLAGQNVKPWLVALSAVATNNSGYMFVGMIGYTYKTGLSAMWLITGWIVGDFFASLFIHKRLRQTTEDQKQLSFAGILSRWHGTDFKTFRKIGGLITIIFLGTYAAAQLNAGGKALYTLFNWEYSSGALIGAVIVLLYCFAGGIRASIWTDAAQSFVMISAMALLFYTAVTSVGSMSLFSERLHDISPTYMDLFPHDLPFGFMGIALFLMGWFFAGFSVVGQPHIMVRFMAMDRPQHMARIRIYYYSWYIAFAALTIGVGLAARLLLPEAADFDAELALPRLAQELLPDILVGLVLAGLFAATMSTADSQILSCTASLTRDFKDTEKHPYMLTKLATVFITAMALMIALYGDKSVFKLVMIAWGALACAFAPLLTLYAFGRKPSEKCAITMMFAGIAVMLIWRHLGYDKVIYEVAPGMCAGFLVYALSYVKLRRKAVI